MIGTGSTARGAAAPMWLRVAVQSVRTATTVGALTALAGFGALSVIGQPHNTTSERSVEASAGEVSPGPIEAMVRTNRCSYTGFDAGVIPSSAIIRTPQGDPRLVSFDDGWAVFTGDVPGELVAVCLGPDDAPAVP
ncbi:hypothetical protein [Aeromicrobium sp.]|uniref:hypothetical protein n=1 Tax=Aeromicrobium sp. TaxID=1871063 RepID=UPI003514388B